MACSAIDPSSLYSSRIFLVMLMRDRPYINPGIKRRTMNGKPTIASLHSMMKATTIACPHHRHRTDKIKDEDIVTLVDQFPGQSIGNKKKISTLMFVGALRARVYDDEVRKFVEGLGVEKISKRLVNSREGPPVFEQPEMTLEKLMEYGNMLVMEKENVKRVRQESPASLCNLRCR
ncbi:hypothetical protein YC2023_087794 [Brassica napus]